MGRTAIEKLPKDIRDQVEAWLREFHDGRFTLDEVMVRIDAQFGDQLGEDVPSRSAVHRHSQKYAQLGERLKRSREVAELLVEQTGPDLSDGKGFKVLVEAFQATAFDYFANLAPDQAVDPENLMFLARAIGSVASAQKTDTERALKVRAVALKDAAAAVEKVAKREGGLTKETVDAMKREILGIDT